jgi:hypothetical protein
VAKDRKRDCPRLTPPMSRDWSTIALDPVSSIPVQRGPSRSSIHIKQRRSSQTGAKRGQNEARRGEANRADRDETKTMTQNEAKAKQNKKEEKRERRNEIANVPYLRTSTAYSSSPNSSKNNLTLHSRQIIHLHHYQSISNLISKLILEANRNKEQRKE